MNRTCGKSFHRWRRRRALTLVEVVAGLMLMATLLVAAMTAFGRHARQIRLAQRKAAAAQALDSLLAHFYERPEGVPLSGDGELDGPLLVWRARLLPRPEFQRLGVGVVRLEAWDSPEDEQAPEPQTLRPNAPPSLKRSTVAAGREKLVAAVELLVPLPKSDEERRP